MSNLKINGNLEVTGGEIVRDGLVQQVFNMDSHSLDIGNYIDTVFDTLEGLRIVIGWIGKPNKDASTTYNYPQQYFASGTKPWVCLRASADGTRSTWYYMDCSGVYESTATYFRFMTRDYNFGRYFMAIGQKA